MPEEKAYEREICGVRVSSRYGSAREIEEIETFIRGFYRDHPKCVGAFKAVSCDSKTGQIDIDLDTSHVADDASEVRLWCCVIANYYYEETGAPRVIFVQTENNSYSDTPDFPTKGDDDDSPPRATIH
jgi:hypothetical protein